MAWDEGMSNIPPDDLPNDCKTAKDALQKLRVELSREPDSYMARQFGAAYASLRRRHHHPTIERFAKMMLSISADLERHLEYRKQEQNQ